MKTYPHLLYRFLLAPLATYQRRCCPPQVPAGARMSYLDNGVLDFVKLDVVFHFHCVQNF